MTDYSVNNDYAAKDALASGDPNKLILGTQIYSEFTELVTAVATKYDSSDIASQAQALAGVDNTTLITPLRLAQALAGAGSGAGMVSDILALVDPNADGIMFWDDSADAVKLATISTGLLMTGTVLTTQDSAINHNALQNYDANRHIDHTAVSITTAANSGLTGGGTIAATRTLSVDISGLTTATIDSAADYMMFLDATDSVLKKSLITSVAGVALGDGAWYTSGQALSSSVEATVVYGTASYNSLQRGTYATGTGIYTAGSSGARIQVTVQARVTSIGASGRLTVRGYHNSTEKCQDSRWNYADSTATDLCAGFTYAVTLAAGDTHTIKAIATQAATLTSGEQYNKLTIVELA